MMNVQTNITVLGLDEMKMSLTQMLAAPLTIPALLPSMHLLSNNYTQKNSLTKYEL